MMRGLGYFKKENTLKRAISNPNCSLLFGTDFQCEKNTEYYLKSPTDFGISIVHKSRNGKQ